MINVGALIAIMKLKDEFGPQLARTMARANSNMNSARDTINRSAVMIGRSIGVATTVLVGLGGAAIKAASDFESSFTGVRKTVNATEEEFGRLSAGLREMAQQIPVNVNELNRIAEAAGQLGIKTKDILGFTEVMAQLGVTTNLSADEAATGLARFRNITGETGTSFGELGSAIVALGNNFETTEAEIVEFALRLAPTATQLGLTEAQILAVGTTLSSLGIKAEAGSSAFSKFFTLLATAAEQGGDAMKEFASLANVSVSEFTEIFEEDAAGAVVLLLEELNKMDAAGGPVFTTLEDLGLSGLRLQTAVLASAAGVDTFKDALNLAGTSIQNTDALTKESELRFSTFASQMTTLGNSVNEVFISMGEMLLPVMQDVVAEFRGYIQREGPMIAEAFGVFLVQAIDFAIGALGRFGKAVTLSKRVVNAVGVQISELKLGYQEFGREALVANIARLEAMDQAIEGVTGALAEDRAALALLDSGIIQTEGTLSAFNDQFNEATLSGGNFQSIIDAMRSKLHEYQEKIEAAARATRENAAAAREAAAASAAFFGELGPGAFAVEGLTGAINEGAAGIAEWGTVADSASTNAQAFARGLDLVKAEHELLMPAVEKTEKATRRAGLGFSDFTEIIRTGNRFIDQAVSLMFKLVDSLIGGGGLSSAFGKVGEGASNFFGKIGSMFSSLFGGGGGGSFFGSTGASAFKLAGEEGAKGILGGLSGILGSVSSFIPIVGPLLAAFGGPLLKGLKSLGSSIGGFFKGIFGGGQSEASKMVSAMDALFARSISGAGMAEAAGRKWAIGNIAIREAFLAVGLSLEEAIAATDRLAAASSGSTEEAMAATAAIQAVFDQVAAGTTATTTAIVQSITTISDTAVNAVVAQKGAVSQLGKQISDTFKNMEFEVPVNFNINGPKGFDFDSGSFGGGKLDKFHTGGTVPGPIGSQQLVVALGGERFTPPGGGGGGDSSAELLFEIKALAASLRRQQDVREVTHRDRSLMGM